jgi:hypothetical protein
MLEGDEKMDCDELFRYVHAMPLDWCWQVTAAKYHDHIGVC